MTTTPYAANSETSRAAAESIAPDTNRLRRIVLHHLKGYTRCGRTCDELEADTGLRHQTASARINELHTRGFIQALHDAEGKPVRRKTRSGRPAQVWIPTKQP